MLDSDVNLGDRCKGLHEAKKAVGNPLKRKLMIIHA